HRSLWERLQSRCFSARRTKKHRSCTASHESTGISLSASCIEVCGSDFSRDASPQEEQKNIAAAPFPTMARASASLEAASKFVAATSVAMLLLEMSRGIRF
ncbi:MAG: hypothetical protein ABI650_04495, partial [Dokdonella sp.]